MAIQFDPFSFGVATFALVVAVMQIYWNRPQRQNAVGQLSCALAETISHCLRSSPWAAMHNHHVFDSRSAHRGGSVQANYPTART
jgi:hypothetical protein